MTRITFIKRAILAGPSGPLTVITTVALAVTIPTLIRLVTGPHIGQSAIFAVYFPAVMLATVLLGWRFGLVTTGLSALAASYFFMPPVLSLSMSGADVGSVVYFIAAALLIVLFADTLRRTFVELEATARREAVLAAELDHRAKNNMAMIEALARQTQNSGNGDDGFFEALMPRLRALSSAQELLRRSDWASCELPALAMETLRPFDHHEGLKIEGPECSLPSDICTPLVLALHELATNAVKYGALSAADGQVDVRWSIDPETALLELEWRERDGPPVITPERRGLGSRLLAKGNPLVDIEHVFEPDGVRCLITIEGARVNPGA